MAAQVSSALAFLEEKRILHRDVAARNVLVNADWSVVKLSDLGAARDVYHREEYIKADSSSARLPIAWMAPESLRDNVYTHKSDVWSFGVLLWEMTSLARTPHGALGPREIIGEVIAGHPLQQPAACTPAMYATMKACWAMNPAERPSFASLVTRFLVGAHVQTRARMGADSGVYRADNGVRDFSEPSVPRVAWLSLAQDSQDDDAEVAL